MAADLSDALQEALAQRAVASATPQTLPLVQRSAYLADALSELRQSGGQNLRTPGALASNLLAEALDRYGLKHSQQELAQQTTNNNTAMTLAEARAAGVDPAQLGYGAGPNDTMAAAGMAAPPPTAGGGAPGAGAIPPSAPAPMMTPPPGGPPQAQAAPQMMQSPPTPPPTPQATPLSSQAAPNPKADMLARVLLGEGGDLHADADVVGNRARLSGQDIGSVIAAPHQFEPYDNPKTWASLQAIPSSSPAYQQALGVATDELTNGPRTNFDHFYGPASQAALAQRDGRPAVPSWDNGTGQDINGQRYFALGYGGQPAIRPGQPPPAPPGGAPGAFAMPPGSAPPQPPSAMGTPLPPPQPPPGGPAPASGQSFAPNPATPPPLGAGNSPAPGGPPQGQPPGAGALSPQGGLAATPQEIALVQQYLHSPYYQLQDKGRQMLMEIAQRQATPQSAPGPEYQWNAQTGQWGPKLGTSYADVGGGPGGVVQRDPFNQVHVSSNPNAGPIPGGAMASFGPNGPQIAPLPIAPAGGAPPGAPGGQGQPPQGGALWSAPFSVPGLAGLQVRNNLTGEMKSAGPSAAVNTPVQGGGGAVWSQKPGEAPSLVQGPTTAEAVSQRGQTFNASQEAQAARNANEAVQAYQGFMGKIAPGGVVGQAAIDAYIKSVSSPNQAVRQGPVNVFLDHQNLPDEVKGEIQRVFGNGFLTPAVLKQVGQMIWTYDKQRVLSAQQVAQANEQWATQAGFDPGHLGQAVPQLQDVPDYARDDPKQVPPPQGRQPGMVVWSAKGPATWSGTGWRLQ